MEYREGRFKTFDNLSLYEQCWKPEGESRAIILIFHGSFEHSGRYSKLALFFVQKGYSVYTFDLRGHGKSEGERCYINSFDLLIKDLDNFLKLVSQREKEKHIFLLGHSVGATILVLFLITYNPQNIKGAILSAPALNLSKGVPGLVRILSPLIGYLFPKLKLGKIDPRFLSQDPKVVSDYLNDPLVYKDKIPAGAVREFVIATKKIQKAIEKINTSLLILHGTEDKLCDIEMSKELYERANCDKTLKIYEGFYHELFNEPNKEKVFSDIILWLKERSYPK